MPKQGEGPECDWQMGGPLSRRHICGRIARWEWNDSAARRRRPVCGIHKRSVVAWWPAAETDIQPIATAQEASQ